MFFVRGHLLPADAPIKYFQHVTQILFTLDNQKNAIQYKTVSQFRSESLVAYPVRTGVKIFLHMGEQRCTTNLVSDYPTAQGLRSVSTLKIISVIRAEIGRVGAARLRSPPEEVLTHYLCSIRATAMHVVKFLDWTLMTIGRWRLLGFMVYIQQQTSSFSAVISVRMNEQPWFRHL